MYTKATVPVRVWGVEPWVSSARLTISLISSPFAGPVAWLAVWMASHDPGFLGLKRGAVWTHKESKWLCFGPGGGLSLPQGGNLQLVTESWTSTCIWFKLTYLRITSGMLKAVLCQWKAWHCARCRLRRRGGQDHPGSAHYGPWTRYLFQLQFFSISHLWKGFSPTKPWLPSTMVFKMKFSKCAWKHFDSTNVLISYKNDILIITIYRFVTTVTEW